LQNTTSDKVEKVCAEPYGQYTSEFERTVSTTENTTESRSAISNTFHNDMEKRNPYQSKSRRRRPKPCRYVPELNPTDTFLV